ncbi:MAG TPA: response regulator [Magnetospirillaceae bacterium]|nr:response regulator [Magnetospirillaceae bacterium]
MNILCVDDSATLRKIVSMSLAPLGHTVVEAGNGKTALATLAAGIPDLIVLDVNMPEMGGIEFLEERGRNPAWKPIPVIVLTTKDEAALREKIQSLGASRFLAKPFQKDQLIAAIQDIARA